MPVSTLLVAATTALALIGLGGGLYETAVVDPAWPARPDIVQPQRGGLSRKRFWAPAHVALEFGLAASLVAAWSHETVRAWLIVALCAHAVMRLWSFLDFIPKAIAVERAAPDSVTRASALAWTRRSRLRLPLDLVTCGALLAALVQAAQVP